MQPNGSQFTVIDLRVSFHCDCVLLYIYYQQKTTAIMQVVTQISNAHSKLDISF